MQKWHISDGERKICRAYKQGCTIGKHFDTKEEADAYIEKENIKKYNVLAGLDLNKPKISKAMKAIAKGWSKKYGSTTFAGEKYAIDGHSGDVYFAGTAGEIVTQKSMNMNTGEHFFLVYEKDFTGNRVSRSTSISGKTIFESPSTIVPLNGINKFLSERLDSPEVKKKVKNSPGSIPYKRTILEAVKEKSILF